MKMKNEKYNFAIEPALHISFDEPFSENIRLNNARLVNGFCGKGMETKSTLASSGISFGEKGLSRYIENKNGFTVSFWAMTYTSYFNGYSLLNIYTENNEQLLRINYQNCFSIGLKIKSRAGENPIDLIYEYNLDGIIVPFGGPTICNDGIWQHIVLTVDYKNNTVSLYLNGKELSPKNGVEINFASNTVEPVKNVSLPDFLGGDPNGIDWSYCGITDDFMLFDFALNANEVLQLYNAYGSAETKTANDDQKLIDRMLEALGDGMAFCLDCSRFVEGGKARKVDINNYRATVKSIDGKISVPIDFVNRYFPNLNDGNEYYSIEKICIENNLKYIDLTKINGVFVLLSENSTITKKDEAYISRLRDFCKDDKFEPKINVEQTRKVIKYSDVKSGKYAYSPSIVNVGGILYASHDENGKKTLVFQSTDKGESWQERGVVEGLFWATLFEHKGDIYLIGTYIHPTHRLAVTKSTDGGLTWSEIREGQGAISYFDRTTHGAPVPVVKYNGRIYRVFESAENGAREVMMSADENSDLINPDSWEFCDYLHLDVNPFRKETTLKIVSDGRWICEGNAIWGKDGRLYCISREESFPIHNKAYLSVLSEDNKRLEGLQLIDFFGGQTKFTARYDEKTDKYIAIVNYMTDGDIAPYQRNYSALTVSDDLIHWELKEILLCDRTVMNKFNSMSRHGYQYIDWIFDGDDIIMVVREAQDGSRNFHDNNYLTFYRIKDYKTLV